MIRRRRRFSGRFGPAASRLIVPDGIRAVHDDFEQARVVDDPAVVALEDHLVQLLPQAAPAVA
jgi:hypothetical protein